MNTSLETTPEPLTIRVEGDLISTNAGATRAEMGRMLDSAVNVRLALVRLDLSRAKMVDSVGLNCVVTLLKRVQSRGGRLQILYSSRNVLRTFTFTRLDKHVELVKA